MSKSKLKTQLDRWESILNIQINLHKLLSMANDFDVIDNNKISDEQLKTKIYDLTKYLNEFKTKHNNFLSFYFGNNELNEEFDKKENSSDFWLNFKQYLDNFHFNKKIVLDEWSEKVNLMEGVIGRDNLSKMKKFTFLNKPISDQIESILEDKTRLIKRTKIKRKHSNLSNYMESSYNKKSEIFDDNDFFEFILKEFKNGDEDDLKTFRSDNTVLKTKKKNLKFSKRLRYDVQEKMVHFMTSLPYEENDAERNAILASLFKD